MTESITISPLMLVFLMCVTGFAGFGIAVQNVLRRVLAADAGQYLVREGLGIDGDPGGPVFLDDRQLFGVGAVRAACFHRIFYDFGQVKILPHGAHELPQLGGGAVARAIVDEDHLVRARQRVERRVQAREQRGQHRLLVVDGDDDGDVDGGRVHDAPSVSSPASASHTRSTSASVIAGNSGSVRVWAPMRSALGKSPAA